MQRTLDGDDWTIRRWRRARGIHLDEEESPNARLPLLEEIRLVAALLALGAVVVLLI